MTIDYMRSNIIFLLTRYLETEYQTRSLADISPTTYEMLKSAMKDRFEHLDLSDNDVKEAWADWFEYAASAGVLVSSDFRVFNADEPYRHRELEVAEFLSKVAAEEIYRL